MNIMQDLPEITNQAVLLDVAKMMNETDVA
jgi:hypothetical protein